VYHEGIDAFCGAGSSESKPSNALELVLEGLTMAIFFAYSALSFVS
jgi:hypothetical protein